MAVTEEEARERWCPFARYTSVRGNGINRWIDDGDRQLNPEPARRIASDCMVWRFARDEWNEQKNNWVARGYCGLAGEER